MIDGDLLGNGLLHLCWENLGAVYDKSVREIVRRTHLAHFWFASDTFHHLTTEDQRDAARHRHGHEKQRNDGAHRSSAKVRHEGALKPFGIGDDISV